MPISGNIKRCHVLQAAIHIDNFGCPVKKQGKKYFLKIGKIEYPIIYVICIASFYFDGFFLLHDANDFNSIQAKNYLEDLDFEILEK